jgi:drug/metabolite transporter (DMT)-like permease
MRSSPVQYALLAAAVLLISTSAIFVRLAQAPSGIIAFYRLLLTLAVLVPVLLCRSGDRRAACSLSPRQWLFAGLSGALLSVHWVMWFESLRYTSIASSTVLVALQPLFSIVFGALLLRERVTPLALAGIVLAIAGSAVIGWGDFRVNGMALWGDVLAFASAGVISLHFLFGQVLRRDLAVLPYTAVCYGAGAVCLALYALSCGLPFSGYTAGTWASFAGIALFATVGGQFLLNALLKYLPATSVTTGILGEPIGTIILAWIIFGEGVTLKQAIGMALILGGLQLYFLRRK